VFCNQSYACPQLVWELRLNEIGLFMTKNVARFDFERGYDFEENGKLGEAFKFYLKAAKHGSIEAQVSLGNLYDEGKGCPKDPQKAVYWYKRAIKAGCPEAAYNLGVHYRQNNKQRWAQYWFKRANELDYES
jgi:TPR repeat protein